MLDTSVLVLNRVYQPVHVTSARRASSFPGLVDAAWRNVGLQD
jgi:hypothetical protein